MGQWLVPAELSWDLVLGHQPVAGAWHRSQHEALIRCQTNSGPSSTALAQRWTNAAQRLLFVIKEFNVGLM